MSVDLTAFRDAETLLWKRWTVFEPNRGDDGTLYAYDANDDEMASLPLDTWTIVEKRAVKMASPFTNGVGIVVVNPDTLDDVHAAVRAWCKARVGRDDVEFPS